MGGDGLINGIVEFLAEHGEGVVFAVVFLEQLGLPLPSMMFLIAAGAMAGLGVMNGWVIALLAPFVAVVPNTLWFAAGRWKGSRMLGLLCRISLDPEACVRVSENMFFRFGPASLLVAKFIPGLSTLAPPIWGIFRMSTPRFLLLDTAGAMVWVWVSLGVGYLFRNQLERVAEFASNWGMTLGLAMASLLAGWIGFKWIQRVLFRLRERGGRLSPTELRDLLSQGGDVAIVDLRHPLEQTRDPRAVPGAEMVPPGELRRFLSGLPPGREVVLYCS